MDGIDTVLVDLEHPTPQLKHALAFPLPDAIATELRLLCLPGQANELEKAATADIETGKVFAAAVQRLLDETGIKAHEIRAIGSHGQTIRHRPDNATPFTIQIGDPNTITELTGITTVSDFRRRDMAAGGQGAHMVPAFHKAVFQDSQETRVILNIGGIANITILPGDPVQAVIGYDTGPGNTLMDQWMHSRLGKTRDENGDLARSGIVDPTLLSQWLTDPYFHKPAPKSTGREYFTLEWLDNKPGHSELSHADMMASLCALTANSIQNEISMIKEDVGRILVCGGGSHNTHLMQELQKLASCPVEKTDDYGVPADWVEAMAFAWLAKQTLDHKPGNIAEVTGASGPRILGGIYQA